MRWVISPDKLCSMFSIVLPTYNEEKNLLSVLSGVTEAMHGMDYEIIIVDDDSPDGTWKKAEDLRSKFSSLRVIRRIGRRGLSSAVLEGFAAAKGDILAVMDADGQHDTHLLPAMMQSVEAGNDLAIGSRYVEGGSIGEWDERRHLMSRAATWLALRLCRVRVKDPMSGFFAIRRSTYERALPLLNPKGFKILLDFLVHIPRGTRVTELPLRFGMRKAGESKLSTAVQFQFLEYLYDVTLGKYLSPFLSFCLALLIIGTIAGIRVWPIRLLYTSAGVRNQVQQELTLQAQTHGWLLSDVAFQMITADNIRLAYHPHSRVSHPAACFIARFSDHSLSSCDEK